jgi:hypothetical protein
VFQIAITLRNLVAVSCRMPLGGAGAGLFYKVMGIVMKKLALLATALTIVSGSALAADMAVKAVKAPPPVQPQAFGRRLLRAALQRHQGRPALYRRCRREHLLPEPRRRRNRHLRRYPPDGRHVRLRLRCLGLPLSGRHLLQRRRDPGLRHPRLGCELRRQPVR